MRDMDIKLIEQLSEMIPEQESEPEPEPTPEVSNTRRKKTSKEVSK